MRPKVVIKYICMVLLLVAAFMLASAVVGLVMSGVDGALWSLLTAAGITIAVAVGPALFFRYNKDKQLSNKEGYCIVVGAWLASCVVGMLPYLLWGAQFSFTNAWFESVSGFTTTGSTILGDIESVPRGLLFWRSCTHLIGGAGVVMFAMLILPVLGRSRMMVSAVELSSIAKNDYKYTSGKIIRILLTVYVGLCVACFVLLKIAGMGWFDAINHAMSTVATGGFSTRNLSIAHWDSGWIEGVTMVFMAVSGLHFGVIFATLTGRYNNVFRSEVARYWVVSLVVATLVVAAGTTLNGAYSSFWDALRFGAFQVVSTSTTSGFVAADTNLWGPLAMVVLMFMAIQCACAGSTSGGLKADRIYLAFKIVRQQFRQQQHPNAIIRIKLGGVAQESSALGFVMLFIVAYMFLMFLGTMIIAAFGFDFASAYSISLASIGNVGPGFGVAGGWGHFGDFPIGVRWVCTLLMLLGRLEIFGLLQLFLLKWWK